MEKSRSLSARLSSSWRIDLPLLAADIRVRVMSAGLWHRLAAGPSARRARPVARPPRVRRPTAPPRPARKAVVAAPVAKPPPRGPSSLGKLLFPAERPRRPPGERARRVPRERPPPPVREAPRVAPPGTRSRVGRRVDVLLFVATLAVLVVVAYGRFLGTVAPTPVDILVSTSYWEMFGDIADSFARDFEAQNPGFRILATDSPSPDIVFFDDGEFALLVESGALASLSPFIYTETGEEQWVLPLVSFVDLFFYNIDILQGAGNDRPPRTRTEFLAAARSVAQAHAQTPGEVFPFALGLGEADPLGIRRDFHPWVWALDAQVHSGFAEDGSLALSGQSAATIGFLAEMNREGLLAPGTFETTGRERLEQFAAGEIAMMLASARDILFLRDGSPGVNFDITAVPAMALGRNRLGVSGIYAGISADSAQPDTAWAFLVFVAGRSHLLASALGAVPGSFFISFPDRYIEEDPMYSKAWDLFEAAEIVEFPGGDILEVEAGRIIRRMLALAFEEVE